MSDGNNGPQAMARLLQGGFRRHLGIEVSIDSLNALSGGASAETWQFRYAPQSEPQNISTAILRRSSLQQASQFSTAIAKRTEAAVQQLCAGYGIPVPDILFCLEDDDGLGEGYVMDCVSGETLPRRILKAAAGNNSGPALAEQCGRILGTLHGIDIAPLTDQLEDQSPRRQLDALETLYRSYRQPSAVFELAFRYLRDHAPEGEPLTLVHGDFRNGNLVIDNRGIAAVLDWELCHLGHPIEDLGWLCVNAWCFGSALPVGGFASLDPLLAAYEAETGRRVTPDQLRYWQLFGTLRWGVICLFQAHCHSSGLEPSLEKAAIGRRVAETEIDMLNLME